MGHRDLWTEEAKKKGSEGRREKLITRYRAHCFKKKQQYLSYEGNGLPTHGGKKLM